jgi:predicted nucleic acid-binding protein
MSDSPALVDTNVVVYAVYPESEHHAASRALLDKAQSGMVPLCVTLQTLAEFYAVVTDARRVTVPRQPEEAIGTMESILNVPSITLLPVPGDALSRLIALARKYRVTRGAIFDLQMVATMLGNGVKTIYTFNHEHFDRFDEIEVLTPSL